MLKYCPSVEELESVHTNIPCQVEGCDKVLPHLSALNMHLSQTHGIGVTVKEGCKEKREYHCPVLGCFYSIDHSHSFSCIKNLKQHYLKIHGDKKFKCPTCDKGFAMDRQQRAHTLRCGVIYRCGTCACPYTTTEAMLTHCRRKGHNPPPECVSQKLSRGKKKPAVPNIVVLNILPTSQFTPNPFNLFSHTNGISTTSVSTNADSKSSKPTTISSTVFSTCNTKSTDSTTTSTNMIKHSLDDTSNISNLVKTTLTANSSRTLQAILPKPVILHRPITLSPHTSLNLGNISTQTTQPSHHISLSHATGNIENLRLNNTKLAYTGTAGHSESDVYQTYSFAPVTHLQSNGKFPITWNVKPVNEKPESKHSTSRYISLLDKRAESFRSKFPEHCKDGVCYTDSLLSQDQDVRATSRQLYNSTTPHNVLMSSVSVVDVIDDDDGSVHVFDQSVRNGQVFDQSVRNSRKRKSPASKRHEKKTRILSLLAGRNRESSESDENSTGGSDLIQVSFDTHTQTSDLFNELSSIVSTIATQTKGGHSSDIVVRNDASTNTNSNQTAVNRIADNDWFRFLDDQKYQSTAADCETQTMFPDYDFEDASLVAGQYTQTPICDIFHAINTQTQTLFDDPAMMAKNTQTNLSLWNNIGTTIETQTTLDNSEVKDTQTNSSLWDCLGTHIETQTSFDNSAAKNTQTNLSLWENIGTNMETQTRLDNNVAKNTQTNLSLWEIGTNTECLLDNNSVMAKNTQTSLPLWDNVGITAETQTMWDSLLMDIETQTPGVGGLWDDL